MGESLRTVLLACSRPDAADLLLEKMFNVGITVVGPVSTASLALSLAGQTATQLAIIADPPTGRRDAVALARDLMSTWGVRSWVIDDLALDEDHSEWLADASVIGGLGLAPGDTLPC